VLTPDKAKVKLKTILSVLQGVTLREDNTNQRWNGLFTKKPHEGWQRKARRLRNEDEDLQ